MNHEMSSLFDIDLIQNVGNCSINIKTLGLPITSNGQGSSVRYFRSPPDHWHDLTSICLY
jgi:hypothetical protein